jgi:hypothetical protein
MKSRTNGKNNFALDNINFIGIKVMFLIEIKIGIYLRKSKTL